MSTPAGWYPDPEQAGQQRYWDGQQWTDNYAPGVAAQTVAIPPRKPGISTGGKAVIGIGAGVLLIGGCAALVSSVGSGDESVSTQQTEPAPATDTSEPEPVKLPEYKAKITNSIVVNPATVHFWAQVKNTGDASGTRDCTVKFHDPNRTYDGWDIFTLRKPLKADRSVIFSGDITVTNEGAVWATEHSIKCE
ncbi:MAG: DUF2510 domain-containing protein [Candidatus Nanopelagicales bacterium]